MDRDHLTNTRLSVIAGIPTKCRETKQSQQKYSFDEIASPFPPEADPPLAGGLAMTVVEIRNIMNILPNIIIIDYDCGYLFSIQRALTELGVPSTISRDSATIAKADKVILPGVGAFGLGMENIRNYGLLNVLEDFVASGKPVLGICLGMQLLMRESYEFGHNLGLNWIEGQVTKLKHEQLGDEPVKIPHIGWSPLEFDPSFSDEPNGVFQGLNNGTYMYFLHSFFVTADDPRHSIATTTYGANKFCSVCRKENIVGVQFHPEISGPSGLRLLQNFVLGMKKQGEVHANVR
jgi:glutamine amidotransferase